MRASRTQIHRAIECLQRLAEVFQARRQALAAEVELTEHQWGVLEHIATEHFMPSLFAKEQQSSAAAVSKTLRQLSDKGLIRSSAKKLDARQRAYLLTPRGKRVMAELRDAREEAISAVWQQLEALELEEFTAFGTKLAAALEDYQRGSTENKLGNRNPGNQNQPAPENKPGDRKPGSKNQPASRGKPSRRNEPSTKPMTSINAAV